jgi:replicative DNA helicase
MANKQLLEPAGGAAYLAHLINQVPTSVHAEHYAGIVRECSLKRQIISLMNKTVGMAYDSKLSEEIVTTLREHLVKLESGLGADEIITPKQMAGYMEHRYGKLRAKESHSVPFGFPSLDSVTGGAFEGEFIVLGGRPGMGKTTLLDQMAQTMSKKVNVLFFHVEMSKPKAADRIVAVGVGMNTTRVRKGNYSDEIFDNIVDVIGEESERKIFRILNPRMTTGHMRSTCYRMKDKYGLGAVFCDYLQILKDKPSSEAYEKVRFISGELMSIPNELDIPLIVSSQLSRRVEERSDKKPMLSDFRESGTIEQDADVVLSLYRPDQYKPEDRPGQAVLSILKHRQGAALIDIPLKWQLNQQRYGELEERY